MDDDVMSSAASYRSRDDAEPDLTSRMPADETGNIYTRLDRPLAQPAADTAKAPISDYRFYCLSGDGHIGFAEWIEAASDHEAIDKARDLRPDADKCEVWHGKRLVAQTNSEGHLEPVPS